MLGHPEYFLCLASSPSAAWLEFGFHLLPISRPRLFSKLAECVEAPPFQSAARGRPLRAFPAYSCCFPEVPEEQIVAHGALGAASLAAAQVGRGAAGREGPGSWAAAHPSAFTPGELLTLFNTYCSSCLVLVD